MSRNRLSECSHIDIWQTKRVDLCQKAVCDGGISSTLLGYTARDNATYFATIQFYFCVTNLYSTLMRAAGGIIDVGVLTYAAVGILGSMAGDLLGGRVFDSLDSDKLKRIIYIGMIVSGFIMLF
ncbi:MAG: sulfite exporter TauE/SafE family protein [Clostridia bacterium]|nr:sulfite exporter TauE/SafE family protein [Clostridia bacterium]